MSIREGDTGPDVTYGPLELADLVRYAGASNDFNPLHYDPAFARSAGQPTIIAHGMLSAGFLASFLTGWFGPDSVHRLKVRFGDPVRPRRHTEASGKSDASLRGNRNTTSRHRASSGAAERKHTGYRQRYGLVEGLTTSSSPPPI